MKDADVVFIGLGAPSRSGDGHTDLSYVYAAAKTIATALDSFMAFVNKSTVAVGAGDNVEKIICDVNPGADFAVVSNPDFLREGLVIEDFKRPDRVVIGAEGPHVRDVMMRSTGHCRSMRGR